MPAILIVRSGSLQNREFKLGAATTRLGRKAGSNDIVFGDHLVSSNHAEIRRSGAEFALVDCDSTNGTIVNGERVSRVRLENRMRFELGEGGPVVEFRCSEEQGADRPRLCPVSGSWQAGMDPVELTSPRTTIGRATSNDVVAGRESGSVVSSEHAVIQIDGGSCRIKDLDSSNGTFVNGKRVATARLQDGDKVEIGAGGPVFEFRFHSGKGRKPDVRDSEQMFQKLERAARGGRAGDQTMMMLQAANRFHRRRRWPLLIVSILMLAVGLGALYLYYLKVQENRRIRASAEDIFYQMRVLQADIARLRDTMPVEEFQRRRGELARARRSYDEFLKNLGLYEGKTPVQQAIMRLARNLGETDLDVPKDFIDTTLQYVQKWRSTPRLRNALDRARQRQLPRIIGTALDQYDLPREFIFLPLQESSYDATQVGPATRLGYAKGLWQLIPSTALQYKLRLGPLKDEPKYDALDQRHDELGSTQAAVQYLRDLYSTKAAASGMLVIAAYNYGQTRIITRLEQLPNDPRERNFWKFYRSGWLPPETRDYVMSIFSAALICEKPDLFQMNIEPILNW
jgi:membrane-bound lytic murein transglycosylase D